MSWCLPLNSKCEWADLRDFVRHLNTSGLGSYRLAACLDVSDSTKKQPEVLLRGSGDTTAVIERKAVVWPPDALKFHRTEHEFTDRVRENLRDHSWDKLYELKVHLESLRGNKTEIKSMADAISDSIINNIHEIEHQGLFR
jgi:hypothetical protein